MGKKIDMVGGRYGRLKVLEEDNTRANDGRVKWSCVCDCGNFISVSGSHLRSGHTQSCGCYKIDKTKQLVTTHGKSRSKVYNAWCNIKERCYNTLNTAYERYGGAGVRVSEDFIKNFQAFYEEVGDPPNETNEWSIDRIDHTKDYEAGNLRWATATQQSQNKGMLSNNTSGYTGVSFMDNGKNEYWVAHWNDINGKQISKCFSIKKLGYDSAKELAIAARKEAIVQLNEQGAEYAENHGL